MNCQTCESQLLDLLYGELDEAAAAEARSHLDGCASCRGAFDKLGAVRRVVSQLPQEEPPSSIDETVMRAARARARDVAASQPRAAEIDREGEGGLWRSIVRFLGSFAMGPQVAMAAVFLLVVGIGLWSLPQLQREDTPPEGGTVVEPETQGEVAPSASLQPAEPIRVQLDPHVGRIRPAEQAGTTPRDRQVVARTEVPRANQEEDGEGDVESGGRVVDDPLAELQADTAGGPAGIERNVAPGEELAVAPSPPATRRDAPSATGRQPSRDPAPAFGGTRAGGASDDRRDEGGEGGADGAGGQAMAMAEVEAQHRAAPQQETRQQAQQQPAPMQPAPQPAPSSPTTRATAMGGGSAAGTAPSPAPPAPPTDSSATARALYDRAMTRYRSRDWEGAIQDFSTTTRRSDGRDLVPSALHHIARSRRNAGQLRGAISQYESLLSRHPAYASAGEAMIELAECHRRLGNLSNARRWLAEAASRYPSVATDARRRIAVIDAEMRAADRHEAEAAESMPASTSDK